MKLIIICLLVVVNCSSELLQQNHDSFMFLRQGALFTSEQRALIENSPLGQAILSLAELQSKTTAFDYKPLWAAIDELGQSLQERKNEENQFYEKEHLQYLSDQQFYQNQITEYRNEVAQLEIEVGDYQEARAVLEQELARKRQELVDTRALKAQSEQEVVSDESTFQQQQKDYNDAIAVIDAALDLLNQVQEGSSLLQKGGDKNVREVGQLMGEKLKNLKSTRRVFYQPLVKAMVQLAEQKFADQQQLQKVIKYMQDLRASLVKNKQALSDSYGQQKAAKQQIVSEYASKVSNLENVIVPGLEEEIETKNGEIRSKQGLLNDAQNNLQDAVGSLEALEKRWVQRTSSHRELVQQYDRELQILEEAETALKRGGVTR